MALDFLTLGIEAIDNQHAELFNRMETLVEACVAGSGNEEVLRTIDFLNDYVNTHFTAEEDLQIQYGYPDYSAHKLQHMLFLHRLEQFKTEIAEKGVGVNIVLNINQMLIEWVRNHIMDDDYRLCDYLKSRM